MARDLLGVNRVIALHAAGSLTRAAADATHGYHRALDRGDDPAAGVWATYLATVLVEQGVVDSAGRVARRGDGAARTGRPARPPGRGGVP